VLLSDLVTDLLHNDGCTSRTRRNTQSQ